MPGLKTYLIEKYSLETDYKKVMESVEFERLTHGFRQGQINIYGNLLSFPIDLSFEEGKFSQEDIKDRNGYK